MGSVAWILGTGMAVTVSLFLIRVSRQMDILFKDSRIT